MEQSYGKLILLQKDGPEQEFELGKASVTLGRAMTNDIVLNDDRISRNHARLDCSISGCTVFDLGSANGIRINDIRTSRANLKPGDTIGVGNIQLRFEVSRPFADAGMTMIDSEADLNYTLDQEFLPMAINETDTPRLIVFTSDRTWDISLEDTDLVTMGRTEENTLFIEQSNVSRHHAEVTRKGNLFILHDLGSSNGTWHRGEKVAEMILQDGDVFRVGQAQIVFKSGYGGEAMTIADTSFARTTSRRPVVFVPGLMGSELWADNYRVWPNIKQLFKHPEAVSYPSEIPLEPGGVIDEIVIVPNLIKLDQYKRMGDYLVEDLGYERGKDLFEFAYDWRQDVRLSARQLSKLIESLSNNQPVTIIAHSLGTLVSRYYVEVLGGKKRVERLMLMGGPHQGAVKALTSMLIAPEILPFGLMGERLRQVILTFPSSYQILPTYPCAIDQNGEKINFVEDESWVPEERLPLLRAGKQFRKELGNRSSVPAISIYGYGLKTISGVTLKRGSDGKLKDIAYQSQASGDSTVLEKSAVLENTEIHPVKQYHGSLFVDNDVKMRLKLELARQFSI